MGKILEFFGLATRGEILKLKSALMDAERDLHDKGFALLSSERNLASVIIERDLYKRESSAHARTAQSYRARVPDAEARCVSVRSGTTEAVTKYRVELRAAGKPPVELRSFVANNKNRKIAHDLADAINLLLPAPVPTTMKEALDSAAMPAVGESLLREATPASNVTGFPNGTNKPKGFA